MTLLTCSECKVERCCHTGQKRGERLCGLCRCAQLRNLHFTSNFAGYLIVLNHILSRVATAFKIQVHATSSSIELASSFSCDLLDKSVGQVQRWEAHKYPSLKEAAHFGFSRKNTQDEKANFESNLRWLWGQGSSSHRKNHLNRVVKNADCCLRHWSTNLLPHNGEYRNRWVKEKMYSCEKRKKVDRAWSRVDVSTLDFSWHGVNVASNLALLCKL